jgi:hypothetical protein
MRGTDGDNAPQRGPPRVDITGTDFALARYPFMGRWTEEMLFGLMLVGVSGLIFVLLMLAFG